MRLNSWACILLVAAEERRETAMKFVRICALLCVALCVVICARPIHAASDVTGTWTGDVSTPDGSSFPLTFVFKQDGAKVTGTVQGSQGDPLTIENGKIDGDKLTFTVAFNGMTISHEGTISGDEIKLSSKSDSDQMPPMSLTLKRDKGSAAPAPPASSPAPSPK
jgi:hypothetical protein